MASIISFESNSAPRSTQAFAARLHPVLLAGAIAIAYFATGKLALLLAIPPGYATAVWPPAGIALAAVMLYGSRVWPGVLLGSLLANLSTSFDPASTITIARSIGIAGAVASGAALQALAAATLIRRFAARSIELTNERQVFVFFLIAGPIGCLTNATIGIATLVLSGAVPMSAAAFNWWTWWVGDSIGALIFAPLILMWLGERKQWRSRRLVVTIPLLAMLGAAVLVFVYASRSEERELRARFNDDAAHVANDIERRLALDVEALRAVAGLFVASETVEADEFGRLAAFLLPSHPEVRAIAWAPRVRAEQRAEFEAMLRASGHPNGILEIADGKLARAGARAEYFPLLMTEAGGRSGRGIGIDLASEDARRDAVRTAILTQTIASTRPLSLLGNDASTDGILLVLPVTDLRAESTHALQGLVVGAFRTEQLIARAFGAESHDRRLRLKITDVTMPNAAGETAVLYQSPIDAELPAEHNVAALDLSMKTSVIVAGRAWELAFTPTLAYLADTRSIVAWLVLACGLALTALVGAGALILTGRTKEVAALVRMRTEELALINEQLADEICDHINTEQKLDTEREFLKTVLENLNEGILVFDEHGKVTMSNRAAREVHQRIVGGAEMGLPLMDQFELREPDGRTSLPSGSSPRERALRGETVRDVELIAIAPDRTPVSLMITSQPLLDAAGERSGAITLVRDVSDAKRVDRLKSEFVSVVSHELRTPLTSIRGSIGLVCGGASGELPPKAKQLLDIAYRNTDRLTTLINDILDIEKIEAGKAQLMLRPTELGPLLEQALEGNAGYAASCEVHLHLHRPVPHAMVNVDANRLLQVMANLLSNAAKFSPRGATVDVSVQLANSAIDHGSQVRVCVRDDGPGIPPEFREHLFQKFSQVDGSDSRSKSGTGLGLAISRALIERMQGRIDFESQPGRGALFFFDLPV
jgi:signal transduction histidine kinase/integral membrane sensor domain MASE1